MSKKLLHATQTLLCAIALTACGGGGAGGADTGSGTATADMTYALLAGSYFNHSGGAGNENAAQFDWVGGMAADSAGNVYVTQPSLATIRKITPAGVVSTLAGTAGAVGNLDGPGASARLFVPWGLTIDGGDNLYVADYRNDNIRKVSPSGAVTTLITTGKLPHGSIEHSQSPQFLVADDSGNVYLRANGILKISPGGATSTLPDDFDTSYLTVPSGIARDKSGNIFLTDNAYHVIHRVNPTGTMSLFAGQLNVAGDTNGVGSAARFRSPAGLATDGNGNVYVADGGNNLIRKISPSGSVSTFAGASGVAGFTTQFDNPYAIATDKAGNVYVADRTFTVRKISPSGLVTILTGTALVKGTKDGTAASIQFNHLKGVATDSNGNLYVADERDHTVRQITPAGVVSTLAGTSGHAGSNDGIGATASFNRPKGIATDGDGNVYVADTGNHAIRRIAPSGEVTTLAGKAGLYGSADGTGELARFREPGALATDSAGNVYVVDSGGIDDTNSTTIRKITSQGTVSTIVKRSNLLGFQDIAVDIADNLYFIAQDRADVNPLSASPNGYLSVFKLTTAGELSTMGKTAAGTKAIFDTLSGIAVDRSGNVYVAQSGSIQRITPTGAVSTLMTKLEMDYGDYDGMSLTTHGTTLYFTTSHGVHALKNALR